MKLFKSSILALSALAAVTFTACSDDNGYVPAAPSNGLYFLESAATTLELPADENSFVVSVSRTGLTDAASYGITVTTDAEDASIFTLPTQAVFAEGAETGTVTFGYDGSKLVSGVEYQFNIAMAENTPACAFGIDNVTFKAILKPNYGPWQKFDKEGVGTYIYGTGAFLFDIDEDPGLPVSVRQSTDNPDMSQIRVEHWGNNSDFFINLNTKTNICSVPATGTGVGVNVGGTIYEMMYTDYYTYCKEAGYKDAESVAESSYYDPKKGRFCLAMAYFVIDGGEWYTLELSSGEETVGYEYIQMNGYKEYTVSLDYKGVYTDADQVSSAIVNVTVSSDATRAKMLLRRNAVSPDAVLAELKNGAEDAVDVNAGVTDQMFQLPLVGPGDYTLVAAAYEGDEVVSATYAEFTISGVQEDPNSGFHRVGLAEICDAWITAAFSLTDKDGNKITYENLVWKVDILESDETPGLYRLVNPWLSPDAMVNYPFSDGVLNLNTKPTSVTIDATNDKCVVIAPQYSGCTLNLSKQKAEMWISNGDGYFLTPEFAEAVELPAVLTKQDLIDMNLATPFNEGDISITDAIYGFSADQFGYQLNLGTKDEPVYPEGYIQIIFDDQKVSPRRAARQLEMRIASRANFEAKRFISNAFSFKADKTFTKSTNRTIKLNKGIIRL